MGRTMHLYERVVVSDKGDSIRVIHVLVGESIAHVQALREGFGSGPRVSSDLCLTGPSGVREDESDCRGVSNVCPVGSTHAADPRTQTRRHASSSPSLLVSAEAGHSALGKLAL